MKDFCTNQAYYTELTELAQDFKKTCDKLALKNTPLTPQATAQFLQEAKYAITIDDAILYSFKIDPTTVLNKKSEKQKQKQKQKQKYSKTNNTSQKNKKQELSDRIRLLFRIAQADFINMIHRITLSDPKFAAGTKVLAELRNILQDNSNNQSPQQAILNITTTNKKTKREKKQEKQEKQTQTQTQTSTDRKPLQLLQNVTS